MKKLQITTKAYQEIIKKIGSSFPEKGGVLIGKDGVITHFIFDKDAKTTGATYALNIAYLNPKMKSLTQQGYAFMGIIHSHPQGYEKLSSQDKMYFHSQFKNFPDLDYLYTPIVLSAKEQEYLFIPYIFHKDGSVEKAKLEILPDDFEKYKIKQETSTKHYEQTDLYKSTFIIQRQMNNKLSQGYIKLGLTAVYFFVIGLSFGILPIAFIYVIKNILIS